MKKKKKAAAAKRVQFSIDRDVSELVAEGRDR